MNRETQAFSNSRRWERFFIVVFLLGAAWAGQRLLEPYLGSKHSNHGVSRSPHSTTTELSTDAIQPTVFDRLPGVQGWKTRQAELTHRLGPLLERTVPLQFVLGYYPKPFKAIGQFGDFTIKAASPAPGAVFKIPPGGQCFELSWRGIPLGGVEYTVEVAKRADFANSRTFGTHTQASFKLFAERGGDIFWRVRAVYGRQQIVSEPRSFLVLEPAMTAEMKQFRDLASRVRDSSAWLMDMRKCQ